MCADLMLKGWEVFRAVSSSSSCDLYALHAEHRLRIEVTTGHRSYTGTGMITRKDPAKFDVLAVYFPGEPEIVYQPPLPLCDLPAFKASS